MKQIGKQMICLLLSLVLLLSMVPQLRLSAEAVSGQERAVSTSSDVYNATRIVLNEKVGNLTYQLDETGTMTISGTGPMEDYAIGEDGSTPNTPWYQDRSLIKKVVITTGITTIGEYAFHGCQNLTDVTISETVTTIGKLAFYNCTGLTELTIPESVTTIGSAAFRRCSGLTKVILPEGVTTIGKIAFFDCTGLTEVNISGSVTTMGEYAFGNCTSLTDITFRGPVPAVDGTCFKMVTATVSYPCNDETWTEDVLQSYGGTLTWKIAHNYVDSVCRDCGQESCGKNIRWELDTLGTLTISGTGPMSDFTDDTLPPWAAQRKEITKVLIQDGITTISNRAFEDCTSLTSVEIPESVTYIGAYAFQNCYSLPSVSLHEKVTYLGVGAFRMCHTLNALLFTGDAPAIGKECFDDVTVIGYYPCNNATWSDSVKKDYGGTVTWQVKHHYLEGTCTVCQQTMKSIGSGRCGLNLHWELDAMGTLTVTGTGNMYEYEYHYDENDPFGDLCQDLPSWHEYRNMIKTVRICDGVTSIGEDAFLFCKYIKTLSIGKDVTKIGGLAFDCSGIKLVSMEGNAPTITSSSFYDVTSATTLSYYEDCVGYAVNEWSKFKHTTKHPGTAVITTPATCTASGTRDIFCTYCQESISETYTADHQYVDGLCVVCGQLELVASGSWWRLYYNGTLFIDRKGAIPDFVYPSFAPWDNRSDQITKAVIGKGTTSIGNYTLNGCAALTKVIIPEGVKSIGQYAFSGCQGLTDVTIPEGVTSIGDGAFGSCSNLTNITFPQSLRIIYRNAFRYCRKLSSVEIPKSVSNIGEEAFYMCERLATVIFRGNAVIFGEECFEGVRAMAYHDCADTTWTSSAKNNAGGKMTWAKLHSCDEAGYCTNCGQAPQLILNFLEEYKLYGEGASVTVYADGQEITTAAALTYSTLITIPYDSTKTYTFLWSKKSTRQGSVVVILNGEILVSETGSALTNGEIFFTLRRACTHQYDMVITPPTCTDEGFTTRTCLHCNDSYVTDVVPATGHSYADGTCTACGEACEHSFDEGTEYAATCTEDGKKIYTCSICGDVKQVAIPSNGHVYLAGYCIVCARPVPGDVPPCQSGEHNYLDSTCQTCGLACVDHQYYEGKCLECGFDSNCYNIFEPCIHDSRYGTWITPPTCTSDGQYRYTYGGCNCETSYDVKALGHEYVDNVCIHCNLLSPDSCTHSYEEGKKYAPTCTTEGWTEYTCTLCGHVKTETFSGPSHSYSLGYCTVCDAICPHKFGTIVWTDPPTCTEYGNGVSTCTLCGLEVCFDTEPTGHSKQTLPGSEPTCTENGLTDGVICSACGKTLIQQETMPAIGHLYTDGRCEHCGEAEPDAAAIPGDVDGNGVLNIIDIARLYGSVKGSAQLEDTAAADFNGDGKINIIDVAQMYAIVKG